MTRIQRGWLMVLAGLPFAVFLNTNAPMWVCQYTWLGMGLIGLTGLWLAEGGHAPLISLPLGVWFVWAMGRLGWMLMRPIADQLSISPVMWPVFHLTFAILFLLVASATWTPEFLPILCRWIARSGVVVVGYSLLQWARLDQFYHPIDSTLPTIVGGVFGNPSLHGAHLSLLLPFFLLQTGWRWRSMSLVTLVLIFQTHSLAAWAATGIVLVWWTWQTERRAIIGLLVLGGIGLSYLLTHPADLDPSGRFSSWPAFWTMFRQQPILGFWTGFVLQNSLQITGGPLFNWRQVHNEYFQVLIEQGVLGAILLSWWLWETGQQMRRVSLSPLSVCFIGVLLAFAVNSLANFPAHLAVTASLGLTAYCGLRVLEHGAT